VYKTTVKKLNLGKSAGSQFYLDLGKVGMMSKVKINGQYAGGAWTYPYRVNITPYVKSGANDIEIEVVNTWGNRIIGDRQLPKDERKLTILHGPAKDAPLQESGLLGDVQIISLPY
jgi:hypothetical protein